ncbi:alkaline phosphatase family protein [Silvibacterium sp.]|uniref:alkaline phosphatase family protein n=1 Tax=Silvibacterium sp. TaxID=1964179 RepID=UPI0039E27725
MKRLFRSPLLAALLLASLPAAVPASAQTSSSDRAPVVIVVTIDGFPARALKDPRLPMPTLRALAASGAAAEGMIPINPSVTWPNHTALITGVNATGHHVLANGHIVVPEDGSAPEVQPWVDKDKLVDARTLYEAATEKGLTTAQVDWVAIYGAKGVTWKFDEAPKLNDVISQELIAQGLVTADQLEHFGDDSSAAWRDEIWTDAAVDIVEKHRPNLLLFHLLQTDTLQHEYGAMSAAGYEAYANADHCLARVVEAVKKAGLADRTTFVIASDHGFASYTKTIHVENALVDAGVAQGSGKHTTGDAQLLAEGGAAYVYIRDKAKRAQLESELKPKLAALEGVAGVYTNEEARAIGIPSDEVTGQAPQLYLVAKPGYAFGEGVAPTVVTENPERGAHGYLNTMPEMQALFVASGVAIKPGVKLPVFPNLRVEPTIAEILGVNMPKNEAPLSEILR